MYIYKYKYIYVYIIYIYLYPNIKYHSKCQAFVWFSILGAEQMLGFKFQMGEWKTVEGDLPWIIAVGLLYFWIVKSAVR